MLTDFNQPIIPYYSPISAKGGKRRFSRKLKTRKLKSRKLRNSRRTRRRYR
jgi:hypothetical protein